MKLGNLIGEGRTSRLFEIGDDSVAKVPRPGVPDSWMELEAAITESVRTLGIRAPEVRSVQRHEGRVVVVFERIVGPSMWEVICATPQPSREQRCVELAHDLADIHLGLMAAGPTPGVPSLVERTARKVRAARGLSAIERVEAEELTRLLPQGAALLHGDLHPGNVLMSSDGPVAVDWFDATIGHPMADVARSSLLMRPSFESEVEHVHLPGATPGILGTLHDAYLDGMASVSVAADAQDPWAVVVAAARLAETAHVNEQSLFEIWRDRPVQVSAPSPSPTGLRPA